MSFSRRTFIRLASGAAMLPGLSHLAFAETYPSHPGKIDVGFPPGTSSDIMARLVAQWLTDYFHQQFVVENKPGAGTNIAAEAVVRAPADGYTILWVTQTNSINSTLYKHLPFNFDKDIEPVCGVIRVPTVMMVNPKVPAKTVAEFIAYAKANPGKINMSSPGIGSINHVLGELFNMMAGVKLVHVPYRTSQFPDLVSGQVQVTFNPLPSSLGFIKNGQLRALAVTSKERQAVLPNVPTIGETVPGYEGTAWFGLGVPAKTPKNIVETLNKAMNAGLADAKFKEKLISLGGVPMPGSPEEFAKFIHSENAKWAKVVKFSGAKVD